MKKTLLIFIVFFFLLILPLASAQESVSMNLSSTDITLYTGETQSINLTIENKQNKFDVFSISVSSLPISGVSISYDYAVLIPANSKITTKLDFSSIIDAPETATLLYVSVISTSDSTIRDSQTLLLRTIKTIPIYIRYKID